MFAQKQTLLVLDNCEHVLGVGGQAREPDRAAMPRRRGARHQPRRTGDRRRTDPRTSTSGGRATGRRHRATATRRRDQPVRRASAASQGRLRAERQQLSCGGRHLPASRRCPTGHRTCGGAGDGVESRRTAASARPPIPGAFRWTPKRDRAARHITGRDRLVLRSAGQLPSSDSSPACRCSRGGCTLEAIEEICSGDPVERDDVMDLVAGLVARSLVVAEDSDIGTRYRLLETIRQYGEERLADCSETEALQVRHVRVLCRNSALMLPKRPTGQTNSSGPDESSSSGTTSSPPWRMPSIPATLRRPLRWWRAIPSNRGPRVQPASYSS